MDWLRRNWPDLAIGLALVAVIAGIVATLITGGSFFPVTPATTPPSISPTVPAVDPPTTDPIVAPGEPATAVAPVPSSDVPPPSPGSVSVLTPDGAEVPTPPPSATPTPTPPVPTTPAPATPAPAMPAPTTPAPTPAAPAPSPATPAPVATAPLPAASGDELAPYRVSVGAFGNPDNAARQALTFRDAGYPVFTGVQGNLTIVLVGPYDTEAEALRVADRIAAGGFGIEPVVYRYRPGATTPGASTPGPSAPATAVPAPTPAPPAASPAPATPAPAPAAPVAPAPAAAVAVTGRSLQVGAFADANSAVPLRQRLASLGLVAFEIREDGLTKLLVGPFEEARLAEVRRQLAAQGIESFPR